MSITRVIATYFSAKEYVKYPADVICYTAPVFFWTNIELSLAKVYACLLTLRLIWFHFLPRQATTKTSSTGYDSSKLSDTKHQSSFGTRYDNSHKPYKKTDELELTTYDHGHASSIPAGIRPWPMFTKQGNMKVITIHQTLS
jgi:hypothetical protein